MCKVGDHINNKMKHDNKSLTLKGSIHILLRIWHYCKDLKMKFYISFCIGNTAPLYYAYVNSYIVREFTKVCVGEEKEALVLTLYKIGLVLLLGFLVYPLNFKILYVTCSKIAGGIKKDIFKHTEKLPVAFIENKMSGDLVTRVTSDYNSAIQLISTEVIGHGNPLALITSISAIGLLIVYSNLILGAISLMLSAASILIINKMNKMLQIQEHKVKEAVTGASQGIVNLLEGILVSRIFGLDKHLKAQYSEKTQEIYNYNLSLIKKKAFLILLIDAQSFLSFAGIVVIGLVLSTKGIVDIPTVTFIATLEVEITTMISELSKKFVNMQKFIVGGHRMFDYMDSVEEIERENKALPNTDIENIIQIKDIVLHYEGNDKVIFDKLNLNIKNNEKLAIVGGSGGGKSTMLKMLLEFVDKKSGDIVVFGNSTENYSKRTLRSFYSYVSQDCYLIDDTIEENVRMGNYNATTKEIEHALEKAYLKEFIDTLPDGIKTSVGERGAKLSGGQKQRIALARAFLKDAPIILLDEATSALDSKSEEEVQKALNALLENRTAIIIAHRLSTIRYADRIIVLEGGHIIENGAHDALMIKDGRYAQLYEMQFV